MKNIYLTFMIKDFAPMELYNTVKCLFYKYYTPYGVNTNFKKLRDFNFKALGNKNTFITLCNTLGDNHIGAPWKQNLYFKKKLLNEFNYYD